jgi:tetratricopeptide (TPR) repeat protein
MASRQHPRNLMLKRQQAHCLYQLEDHARAAALFAESIDGNDGPVSSAELAEYGDACLLTGDYQRAQRIFDEIARAYPVRLKEIELLRGLCAYKLGDTTRASEIVATARTEWPQESRFDVLRQMCSRQEGRGIVTATHVSKIGQ